MKKVVLASLLAIATAAPFASMTIAQQPAANSGSVQMSADEYAAYNNANTQTTPAAKAAAFEAYLKAYPKSAVKADVLNQLLFAYSQMNNQAQTLDAADRLLEIDPSNLRALTFEVYYRRQAADPLTDPTAKCAALDKVASYAQTGLSAAKPAATTQEDFDKLKTAAQPTYESAVADDDICKKDNAGAITALKAEIDANQDKTKTPNPVLQDVFTLAQAYYTSTPPDYLNCAWYATRAATYAQQFAAQIQPLATYCYKKYHGGADGYATLQTMVQTQLDPPADLSTTIKAAPKPEDIIANLIATTPDLAALAISDREFVLQYGTAKDPKTETLDPTTNKPDPATGKTYADEVFDVVKGKSVELPGVLVIAATADQLQVAVSDDAVQSKTADFTFTMKEPIKAAEVPAVGAKVTLDGTYASYTQKPLVITMSDGALVLPKKPTPAHHAPVHHKAH
jgi:hypothetical protein